MYVTIYYLKIVQGLQYFVYIFSLNDCESGLSAYFSVERICIPIYASEIDRIKFCIIFKNFCTIMNLFCTVLRTYCHTYL